MHLKRLLLLAAALLMPSSLLGQEAEAEWYVSTTADLAVGTSVRLSNVPYGFQLSNGWDCTVTPLSEMARYLSCSKAGETVATSVSCKYPDGRNHVQLSFETDSGGRDFVQLSCEASSPVALLYRSSATDPRTRVHVATFDAPEAGSYNRDNCGIARDLFSSQPGVVVRYWCEERD